MGVNVVPLNELTPDEPKVLTLDLLKNLNPDDPQNEKPRGQIVLEVLYKPFKDDEMPIDTEDPNVIQKAPEGTPDGGGLLVVIVHEAQDLEGKNHTNPSVKLLFRGEERKTKVSHKLLIEKRSPQVTIRGVGKDERGKMSKRKDLVRHVLNESFLQSAALRDRIECWFHRDNLSSFESSYNWPTYFFILEFCSQ